MLGMGKFVRRIDHVALQYASTYGVILLRGALGVVFLWFGALKLAQVSPVADLVSSMALLLPASFFLFLLGVWEITIGIGLLLGVALRLVLVLLLIQIIGTFLTLVIHPELSFQHGNPLLLTFTGEFIAKNVVLAAAGVVVAGTLHKKES